MARTLRDLEAQAKTLQADALLATVQRCIKVDPDKLQRMVSTGELDVELTDKRGDTPLMTACSSDNYAAVEALIAAGANVNARNNARRTALMRAAANGRRDYAAVLLAHGANVFLQDMTGKTALDWARKARHAEVVVLLEDAAQASLRKQVRAARDERNAKLRREVLTVNDDNAKRLKKAMATGVGVQTVDAIMAVVRGSNLPKTTYRETVATLLEEAKAGDDDGLPMVGQLAGAGEVPPPPPVAAPSRKAWADGDPELRDFKAQLAALPRYYLDMEFHGFTALTKVAMSGDPELVQEMLDAGALADVETSKGFTALSWACVMGHRNVAYILLRAGATIDYPSVTEGKTPLMQAAYNGHTDTVLLLLQFIFDRSHHADDVRKRETAARGFRTEIEAYEFLAVDWVDEYEAAVNRVDHTGRTALAYAEERSFPDMAKTLLSSTARAASRREVLAKVKKDARLTFCPLACGYRGRADTIERHTRFVCRRRPVACVHCGVIVPEEVLVPAHVKDECPKRLVNCRNLHLGCLEVMPLDEREHHENRKCLKRIVPCRLECGKSFCWDERAHHEQHGCMVYCRQGCGHWMQRAEEGAHKPNCPKRLTFCRRRCGEQHPLDELPEHENVTCVNIPKPCHHGCGEMLFPPDVKDRHERFLCELRPVACKLGCGVEGLVERDRPGHEAAKCLNRVVDCELGCGTRFLAHEIPYHHEVGEWAVCSSRLVRCRYDSLNKPIVVREDIPERIGRERQRGVEARAKAIEDALAAAVAEAARREMDTESSFSVRSRKASTASSSGSSYQEPGVGAEEEEADDHPEDFTRQHVPMLASCSNVLIDRFDPDTEIARLIPEAPHTPVDVHLHDLMFDEVPGFKYQCGWFKASDRKAHEAVCPMRRVECRLGCGQKVPFAEIKSHTLYTCVNRFKPCKNGCGAFLKDQDRLKHETEECPLRLVKCACGREFKPGDLDDHKAMTCPVETIFCSNFCGARLERSNLQRHLTLECTKRLVACPLQCGVLDLYLDHVDMHVASDCPLRMLPCTWECGMEIAAQDLEEHKMGQCTHRPVLCRYDCGHRLPFKDMPNHERTCAYKPFKCPQGCGIIVTSFNQQEHEERVCEYRFHPCRHHCGMSVRKIDIEHHDANVCMKRKIPCPYGCGLEFRAEVFELHKDFCEEQPLPCGTGALPCTRKLSAWVQGDKLNGCGYILKCSTHKESPLVYCARHNKMHGARNLLRLTGGANVDTIGGFGYTPLSIACREGHMAMAMLLIDHGADVNLETPHGSTPLIEAARYNNFAIVEMLVQREAVVHQKNKQWMTAADWAHRSGHVFIGEYLTEQHRMHRMQPRLMLAVNMGDMDTIEQLVGKGRPYAYDALGKLESELKKHKKDVVECTKGVCFRISRLAVQEHAWKLRKAEVERRAGAISGLNLKANAMEARAQDNAKRINTTRRDLQTYFEPLEKRDKQDVLDVRRGQPWMDLLMEAVCVLHGVDAKTRPDDDDPYTLVPDWFKTGQELLTPPHTVQRIAFFDLEDVEKGVKARFVGEVVPRLEVWEAEPPADIDRYALLGALFRWVMAAKTVILLRPRVADGQAALQSLRATITEYTLSLKPLALECQREAVTLADIRKELPKAVIDRSCAVDCVTRTEGAIFALKLMDFVSANFHTPLTFAACRGSWRAVEFFLENGASPNYPHSTAQLAAGLIQAMWRQWLHLKAAGEWTYLNTAARRRLRVKNSTVLAVAARRYRRRRLTSRLALSEAMYNGHFKAMQKLYECHAWVHAATTIVPDANFPYRSLIPVPPEIPVPEFDDEDFPASRLTVQKTQRVIRRLQDLEDEDDALDQAEARAKEEAKAAAAAADPVLTPHHIRAASRAEAFDDEASPMQGTPGELVWPRHKQRGKFQDLRHSLALVSAEEFAELANASALDEVARQDALAKKRAEETRIQRLAHAREYTKARKAAEARVARRERARRAEAKAALDAANDRMQHALDSDSSEDEVVGVGEEKADDGDSFSDASSTRPEPGSPDKPRELQIAPKTGAGAHRVSTKPKLAYRILDRKLSCLECACLGYYHFDRGTWKKGVGWVRRNRFMDVVERAVEVMRYYTERNEASIRQIKSLTMAVALQARNVEDLAKMEAAVFNRDWQHMDRLLDAGCPANMSTEGGHTLLTIAAYTGASTVTRDGAKVLAVEMLLDRPRGQVRPDVNAECRIKHTPLTIAAYNGREAVMEALIARGADINRATTDGLTPLMFAAINSKVNVVRLLVNLGANPDLKDKRGKTAMQQAHGHHCFEAVKLIGDRRLGVLAKAAKRDVADPVIMCPWGCGERFDESIIEIHASTCGRVIVPCYLGCGATNLFRGELVEHARSECPKRRIRCPQGCVDVVPEDELEAHITDSCAKTTIDCPHACGSSFLREELAVHCLRRCSHRPHKCHLCGEDVPHNISLGHVANKCPKREVACRNGCDEVVLADEQVEHETETCKRRPMDCECGLTFPFAFFEEHAKGSCLHRLVECPRGCTASGTFQAKDMEHHLKAECELRIVLCPDGCGDRVAVADIPHHRAKECGLRIVTCKWGCGRKHLTENERKFHEDSYCGRRYVPCGLGCGQEMCITDVMPHRKTECPKRRVRCERAPKCVVKVPLDEMEHHLAWDCRYRNVYCPLGCKEVVYFATAMTHMTKECPKRLVTCKWGCGDEVKAEDIDIHEASQCLHCPVLLEP